LTPNCLLYCTSHSFALSWNIVLRFVGPTTPLFFSKLESCQRRLTKWCKPIRHLYTYEERLVRLKLPSLRYRFDRGDAILTFQILNGLLDVNPINFFTFSTNQTRGHSFKLRGYKSSLCSRQSFFTERVVFPWNKLTEFVVSAPSLNSFKVRYDALQK